MIFDSICVNHILEKPLRISFESFPIQESPILGTKEMITRYPILEYLSNQTGSYKSVDDKFSLEFKRNGYGFVVLSEDMAQRSQFYGLIGVNGKYLELHASLGMPNIMLFSWYGALNEIDSEDILIVFTEAGGNISISFLFGGNSLKFSINVGVGSQNTKEYELEKAVVHEPN